MRKSIIAVIVLSAVSSFAANAANNMADFQASFDSYKQHMNDSQADAEYSRLGLPSNIRVDVDGSIRDGNTAAHVASVFHVQFGDTTKVVENPPLDSNATDSQRHEAQQAALRERFNQLKGEKLDQLKGESLTASNVARTNQQVTAKQDATQQQATHLDGSHQAFDNGSHLDGKHHETAQPGDVATPRAGKDGKNGITTVITKKVNDVQTQAKVARNEKRIAKVEKDVKDIKRTVKALGASAAASANLHYNRNESGYAVAVGEYEGSTAIAGGVQFATGKSTAVTVQASYDGEGVGASVGFHGNW